MLNGQPFIPVKSEHSPPAAHHPPLTCRCPAPLAQSPSPTTHLQVSRPPGSKPITLTRTGSKVGCVSNASITVSEYAESVMRAFPYLHWQNDPPHRRPVGFVACRSPSPPAGGEATSWLCSSLAHHISLKDPFYADHHSAYSAPHNRYSAPHNRPLPLSVWSDRPPTKVFPGTPSSRG